MPIYAYRCSTCGHARDVLQKMSDPLLTVCPECGASTFVKQVTAAGFQLKGSGWYVTDFRGDKPGGAAAAKTDKSDVGGAEGGKSEAAPSEGSKTESPASPAAGSSKGESASAPAAAPAPATPAPPPSTK
jgi:putative FmdB family regulatory protein